MGHGTWVHGMWGLGDVEHKDVSSWGGGDEGTLRHGTQGCQHLGTWGLRTWVLGDMRQEDVINWGCGDLEHRDLGRWEVRTDVLVSHVPKSPCSHVSVPMSQSPCPCSTFNHGHNSVEVTPKTFGVALPFLQHTSIQLDFLAYSSVHIYFFWC